MDINKLFKIMMPGNLLAVTISQIIEVAASGKFTVSGELLNAGEEPLGEMDLLERALFSLWDAYQMLLEQPDDKCCRYIKKIDCCDNNCDDCNSGRSKINIQANIVDDWMWDSIVLRFPHYDNERFIFCLRAPYVIAVRSADFTPVGTYPVASVRKGVN